MIAAATPATASLARTLIIGMIGAAALLTGAMAGVGLAFDAILKEEARQAAITARRETSSTLQLRRERAAEIQWRTETIHN